MAPNTEEDLDAIRAENIAKNRALLAEMFSETSHDFVVRKKPTPKPQRKAQRPPKRKVDAVEGSDDGVEKPAPKAIAVPTEAGGVRRSGRNAGKKVNYGGDGDHLGGNSRPRLISEAAQKAERASEPKSTMNRKYDP